MKFQKQALRAEIKALLQEQAPHEERRSAEIRQAILSHPLWKQAETVALFAPLPGEPNLIPLCENAQKQFVFPKIAGEALLWGKVSDPKTDLKPSPPPFRTLEPLDSPLVPPSQIQLFLVPGIAFTSDGYRLGRGRGFYDRILSSLSHSDHCMGVCFSFQIRPLLPVESHDQRVHGLFHA